jgi:hypothetical protein
MERFSLLVPRFSHLNMSTGSPKLARREHAIEAARRRLRRLEIEAHRIKAELARLEADYEDDVADWLSRKLRRRTTAPATVGSIEPGSPATMVAVFDPAATEPARDVATAIAANGHAVKERATTKAKFVDAVKDVDTGSTNREAASILLAKVGEAPSSGVSPGRRAVYRRAASPLLCSFALHAIVLSFCVTITIATVVRQDVPLLSTPADLDEISVETFSDVEIPPTKFEDAELQNVVYESPDFNISDQTLNAVEPTAIGAGTQSFGDIGQLDALPSDLGSLMSGAGQPGGGVPGGPAGEAIFFGARSKGDRFVFVVDNSSSMKGGRLQTAVAELLNTTNGLTPKQSFYVIFVSDQAYPMFFPQREPDLVPATPENKKRLASWLPNAILASGNNRKMIEAMDMAAALRPHAVFLLWDGDMKYSDKVRMDVMTHLTRPNPQWNFVIHTLGMGVTSLDAEQNLVMIAQAHGGTFRKVNVPVGAGR